VVASSHHHQGGRPCQSERRIHPAAPVRFAGLPDESGVPVVVSRRAPMRGKPLNATCSDMN
jgi:hypothetical protein